MCGFTKFVPYLEILLNILEMYDKMQTSKEATNEVETGYVTNASQGNYHDMVIGSVG